MRCPDCHSPLFECDEGLYCSKCQWDSFTIETENTQKKHKRLPIFHLVRKKKQKARPEPVEGKHQPLEVA